MNIFDNQIVFFANLLSNGLALLVLWAAWKRKRAAQVAFFLIFGLAGLINWQTALNHPEAYLTFAQVAVLPLYQQFILGWFSNHILLMVGVIAGCQALIAAAMLSRGWFFKTGVVAGILFLLAVTPLGLGSAFPCTLILALALPLLWRSDIHLFSSRSPLVPHG